MYDFTVWPYVSDCGLQKLSINLLCFIVNSFGFCPFGSAIVLIDITLIVCYFKHYFVFFVGVREV